MLIHAKPTMIRCTLMQTVAVLLLAWVSSSGCGRRSGPTVTIRSEPPGASIWINGRMCGVTPSPQILPSTNTIRIRLTLRRHDDWTMDLPSDGAIPPEIVARLKPEAYGKLTCRTTPAGAEVVVDGEPRGETPLTLEGLEPRVYQISCRLPGFLPDNATVTIDPDHPEVTHETVLEDKTTAHYRERLAESPDNTTCYTDLAHHLFVSKHTDEACSVLIDGLIVMESQAVTDRRLISELERTLAGQYYRDADRASIKARLLECLEARLNRLSHPSAEELNAHIGVLILLKEEERAARELRLALAFYPDDERLKKQLDTVLHHVRGERTDTEEQRREQARQAREEYMTVRQEYSRRRSALQKAEREVKTLRKRIEESQDLVATGDQRQAARQQELDAVIKEKTAAADALAKQTERRRQLQAAPPGNGDYGGARAAFMAVAEAEMGAQAHLDELQEKQAKLEQAAVEAKGNLTQASAFLKDAAPALKTAEAALTEAEEAAKAYAPTYEQARLKYAAAAKKGR